MALPVNFKDDVLASSMDGKRRYNMITNSDGTVSFEDVTTYSQEGSNFGSAQINNTNGAINKINNNVLDTIEEISANTSGGKFAGALALKNVNNSLGGFTPIIDSTGKITGYKTKVGADTVFPFSSIKTQTITQSISMPATTTKSYIFIFDELEEVKGVLQITKKSTNTYGTYQYLIPVDGANQNADGSFLSINGNTVKITLRNQVNTSSTADWTITAVGF